VLVTQCARDGGFESTLEEDKRGLIGDVEQRLAGIDNCQQVITALTYV